MRALAIVDKRRTDMNVTEVMHVIGDVHGRTCFIIDDIIDTAGTLVKTVRRPARGRRARRVRLRHRTPCSPVRPWIAFPSLA